MISVYLSDMVVAYFDSAGGLVANFFQEENGVLEKNALILVEGTHTDNKGRVHNFPAHRVQAIVDNTNAMLDEGREVPLCTDHPTEVIKNGKVQKLGEVSSYLECRVISPRDLPNPKMTNLVGKLGAFAKVQVRDRIDEVKKGLLKLLSPGVDLENERVGEVSFVLYPAIAGPAVFAAPTTYADARKQSEEFKKTRTGIDERVSDLWDALRAIDNLASEQEMFVTDTAAQKLKAIDDFAEDLKNFLGVDVEAASGTQEESGAYLDAYQPTLPQPPQTGFARSRRREAVFGNKEELIGEREEVSPSSFVGNGNGLKRRRRGV